MPKLPTLNRRVTILYDAGGPVLGDHVENWKMLTNVAAHYQPTSDGERQRAAEAGAVIDARFQIQRSSVVAALSGKHRLTFEGRTFNIAGVKEIVGTRRLEISARARAE